MALKFISTKIVRIVRETPEAVSICFENPDKQVFNFIPGQYLTLKVNIDGHRFNRAYSLSSCPYTDADLVVTVKVTPGGKVSTWINQSLKEGMQMEILPPLGNFTALLNPANNKHYILIGAGSGITPLMSILRSVLHLEPNSKITLLYGNRDENSIIFEKTLKALKEQNPNRLEVIHSLSQGSSEWTGNKGRLNIEKIKELLEHIPTQSNNEYFICGPSGMMAEAKEYLKIAGIPTIQIHEEHFSAPLTHADEDEQPKSAGNEPIPAQVTVILDGKESQIQVKPSESILDACLDHDIDPPYACMIGSCCTCKAKLISGKVIMDDREGLSDKEIAAGYILTCQSHPITEDVTVNYDA